MSARNRIGTPVHWPASTDHAVPDMTQRRWHTSRSFRAHGWRFAVRSDDPSVVRLFDEAFVDLTSEQIARRTYQVVRAGDRWSIRLGSVAFGRLPTLGEAVGIVLGNVNRQAVRTASRDHVVFHAACAERDGVGVVLAGAMESGKTTTVAGLLGAGFAYLTDEAVALDPKSLLLHGYPKPLSIDPGSWQALAHLAPRDREQFRTQWQVPGSVAAPAGCAQVARAGVVVSVRYSEGGATRLVPVGRSQMLVDLVTSAFHLKDDPRRCFQATADMLRRCHTYRLEVGRLEEAVHAISTAVDRRANAPEPPPSA
jgi:hypothetical protein